MIQHIVDIAILIVLIALVFLIYFGAAWRKRRACDVIIENLKKKGAVDPATAIRLPHVDEQHYESGMKNYKLKALEFLIMNNVVCSTVNDRYYLGERVDTDE